MKNRVTVKEAISLVGETVCLKGHLHSLRNLGKLCFLNLRDRSGLMQIVTEDDDLIEKVSSLSLETPIQVSGTVVGMAGSTMAGAELKLESLEALAHTTENPPVEISKDKRISELSTSALLDYRPLTLRNPLVKAIFVIEAEITRAFREYLTGQSFVEIHSPKIVATGTEGGAQLFKLDYFGRQAFLAQSPQFYKQIMVGVYERVFETAAVYRAEEHDTTRHLNEYVSLDFEMGFVESEQDVISMQIELLKHILASLTERCSEELALYGITPPVFNAIPQVALAEAVELLRKNTEWSSQEPEPVDLDQEGERLLCEYFLKHEGSEFVYVTRYPLAARPFYARPQAPQNPLSRSFDLLFRGLEITTGGQRIHEYQELYDAISARGHNPEDFCEYLQCFRYGMPPHGGLAIGLERLTKQLLGLKSVKQTSLFPRDINRLTP